MNSVTVDTISLRGAGVVSVSQPARGHRFTLDSILLADFCRIRSLDHVLEPGSGTGVISLLLAKKHPRITITAVEFDAEAADLCRWNAQANRLDDRVTVLNRNVAALRALFKPGSFDAIVANPPYTRSGTGRASPAPKRQAARQSTPRELAAWLDLDRLLKNKGRYFVVFSAGRAAELMADLRRRKLEPKRAQWIHPFPGRRASRVLIEAVKTGGTGLEVMPPLMLYDQNGSPSRDLSERYELS